MQSTAASVRGKGIDSFGAGQVLKEAEGTKEFPRCWDFLVPGVGPPQVGVKAGDVAWGTRCGVRAGNVAPATVRI